VVKSNEARHQQYDCAARNIDPASDDGVTLRYFPMGAPDNANDGAINAAYDESEPSYRNDIAHIAYWPF
jgi:hypothetical protein